MKRITFIITLVALSAGSSFAQRENLDDLTVVQTMYGIEKRKLVSDYMKVPEAQATDFWSLYDKYEAERKELGKARYLLIGQYADNYASLTEEKADEIAKGLLANSLKYEKLHEAYYSKFKKVTSAITAAKFMQLEVYLQSQIRNEVQETIPFIGEIELLQKN
jgi:hypothetical protein